MTGRNKLLWVCTALGGVLLLPLLGRAQAPAQDGQAKLIDLKLVEEKSCSSWYGFMPDKDGRINHAFASSSGKLPLIFANGKIRVDGAAEETAVKVSEDWNKPTQIKAAIELAGKTVQYPFFLVSQKSADRTMLLVGSGAALEGTFDRFTIRIFDGNIDGRFGGQGDRMAVAAVAAGAGENDPNLRFGSPWSRVASLGQKLYNVELIGGGAQLKLAPYTGPVAEVHVEFDKSVQNPQVMLQGDGEGQVGVCRGKDATLFVPGKYRIYTVSYQAGSGERPGFMSGSHDPDKPPFELKEGKNTLKFGPPLKMEFTASYAGGTLDISAAKIMGVGGECYRPYIQDEQKDSFASYIRAGGKEMKLAKLEFS